MQGRLGPQGPVVLITLPCPALGVRLSRREGPFALFQPQGRATCPAQAIALMRAMGRRPTGRYVLRPEMPVGAGAGSSTAALLALAQSLDHRLPRPQLEALLIALEGASDPLLQPAPERVLWASRQGKVLAHLPPLPRMQVVAGFQGNAVFTDPQDVDFPDISDLILRWKSPGLGPQDYADLASTAAERSLTRRGPANDQTARLAAKTGAMGFAIAYTGAARALLFAPGQDLGAAHAAARAVGWRQVIQFPLGSAVTAPKRKHQHA